MYKGLTELIKEYIPAIKDIESDINKQMDDAYDNGWNDCDKQEAKPLRIQVENLESAVTTLHEQLQAANGTITDLNDEVAELRNNKLDR